MKILGVGLSKTGTTSLHRALEMLGFHGFHFDRKRMRDILDGSNPNPDFRRYDDVEVLTDLPTAYFYRELLAAYPESKAILTIREPDAWWKSVEANSSHSNPLGDRLIYRLGRGLGFKRWPGKVRDERKVLHRSIRNYVFGSVIAHEFLYKKKYLEHNERVQATVPAERLLVMDLTAGDGWEKLCPFLGLPVPSEPFPHLNPSVYDAEGA